MDISEEIVWMSIIQLSQANKAPQSSLSWGRLKHQQRKKGKNRKQLICLLLFIDK